MIPFLPFPSPVHIPALSFSQFQPTTALTPHLAAPPGQLSLTGLEGRSQDEKTLPPRFLPSSKMQLRHPAMRPPCAQGLNNLPFEWF